MPTKAVTHQYSRIKTIDELMCWKLEEQRDLPLAASTIAELEAAGYIVNLLNGDLWPDPDVVRRR